MLHRALNSIPAKPVLVLAPLVMVVVLGIYYYNLKQQCTERLELRQTLLEKTAQSVQSGEKLRLSDVVTESWELVKGFQGFKPEFPHKSCPFSWGWPDKARQSVIDEGLLSVFIFFNEGAILGVLEFRSDQISMDEINEKLTRESAVFRVSEITDNSTQRYHLSLETGD